MLRNFTSTQKKIRMTTDPKKERATKTMINLQILKAEVDSELSAAAKELAESEAVHAALEAKLISTLDAVKQKKAANAGALEQVSAQVSALESQLSSAQEERRRVLVAVCEKEKDLAMHLAELKQQKIRQAEDELAFWPSKSLKRVGEELASVVVLAGDDSFASEVASIIEGLEAMSPKRSPGFQFVLARTKRLLQQPNDNSEDAPSIEQQDTLGMQEVSVLAVDDPKTLASYLDKTWLKTSKPKTLAAYMNKSWISSRAAESEAHSTPADWSCEGPEGILALYKRVVVTEKAARRAQYNKEAHRIEKLDLTEDSNRQEADYKTRLDVMAAQHRTRCDEHRAARAAVESGSVRDAIRQQIALANTKLKDTEKERDLTKESLVAAENMLREGETQIETLRERIRDLKQWHGRKADNVTKREVGKGVALRRKIRNIDAELRTMVEENEADLALMIAAQGCMTRNTEEALPYSKDENEDRAMIHAVVTELKACVDKCAARKASKAS